MKTSKRIIVLFFLIPFFVVAYERWGSLLLDNWGSRPIENVSQCEKTYVADFLRETFGVDVASPVITSCSFKLLGYGGEYNYSISLRDDIRASVYYSGGGSGGHGYTTYCFFASSQDAMNAAQNTLCGSMSYVKDANPMCADSSKFDATASVIESCKRGLFTSASGPGSVISYTQATSRCGRSIAIGTFDCVSKTPDTEESKIKLDELIESLVCRRDSDCVVRVNNYNQVRACPTQDKECIEWEKTAETGSPGHTEQPDSENVLA